jgi:hypothetical protein
VTQVEEMGAGEARAANVVDTHGIETIKSWVTVDRHQSEAFGAKVMLLLC